MKYETAEQHRESIFHKLDGILDAMYQNTEMQAAGAAKDALGLFLTNIGRLVNLMADAKDDASFVLAAQYVDEILGGQIFEKVYGKEQVVAPEPETKPMFENIGGFQVGKIDMGNLPKDFPQVPQDAKVHVMGAHMMTPEQKREVAQVMRKMGLSDTQIKNSLGL